MTALYADEHAPLSLVLALRLLGQDVVTIQEDGWANRGLPDADVLARATALGRAVLTNNRRHFHTLHRASRAHAGIVTYTHDPDHAALAGRVHAAVLGFSFLAGQLVKITRPNRPPTP